MTRLEGNFTMILLARGGDETRIRSGLERVASGENLSIHVENAVPRAKEPEPDLFVQALGPNRTGIVARLSRVLSDHGANIVEMTTRLLDDTEVPTYLVRIEAVSGPNAASLRADLESAGRELGVEVRATPLESADL